MWLTLLHMARVLTLIGFNAQDPHVLTLTGLTAQDFQARPVVTRIWWTRPFHTAHWHGVEGAPAFLFTDLSQIQQKERLTRVDNCTPPLSLPLSFLFSISPPCSVYWSASGTELITVLYLVMIHNTTHRNTKRCPPSSTTFSCQQDS